jgi:transposase
MKLRNEDLKEIARLVDEGYVSLTIAGMFNYSKGTIQALVARYKKT